jgi:hypothetical protein
MFEFEEEQPPYFELPIGCRVENRLIRCLWSENVLELAICAPDDGFGAFLLVAQFADGRVVRLADFATFEEAYRVATGKAFDSAEIHSEEAGGAD